MGLLGDFTEAVDARKRYYANIARGLLADPRAWWDQASAQFAEDARSNMRQSQEQFSVMPEVADPARQQAFNQAMNVGLLGMTSIRPKSYNFQSADKTALGAVPDGFSIYPSGNAAFKLTDNGRITLYKEGDKYIADFMGPWPPKIKDFHVIGDSTEEVINAATAKANKMSSVYEKKLVSSLPERLRAEFGDSFAFKKSERSGSQYITYTPTGEKIRISDHGLPLGYEPADLELSNSMTNKQLFDAITKYLKSE